MRKALVGPCTAALLLFGVAATDAQTRGISAHVSRLVAAQCTGPAPCDVGITFTRGDVLFQPKQPGPVFSSLIGRISLDGVVPPVAGLSATVSARVSYGADPTGDCPLANTQTNVNPWATSSLVCAPAEFNFLTKCSGQLHLTTLVPAECSDVDIIVEDIATDVYESGFVGVAARHVARDGHAVPGSSPDCSSGGRGCP